MHWGAHVERYRFVGRPQSSNKRLTLRWFDEVWNQKRADTIDALFATDGIAYGLGEDGRELPGPPPFRDFWAKLTGAFPDFHIEPRQLLAEGDCTVIRFAGTGTHLGEGLGIPPTGRAFAATGMCILRWRDGQIFEA